MKLLAKLTDKDIGSETPEKPNPRIRRAARAVLFDGDKVALLHVSKHNYDKLPGGGIEPGEEITAALQRELLEETGCEATVLREIGRISEHRARLRLIQHSYCFVARVKKNHHRLALTKKERNEGFKLRWISPNEAIQLLATSTTKDYEGKFICHRDRIFLEHARN